VKGQKSRNYLNHDCCQQSENDIFTKDSQSLKTEPRMKFDGEVQIHKKRKHYTDYRNMFFAATLVG